VFPGHTQLMSNKTLTKAKKRDSPRCIYKTLINLSKAPRKIGHQFQHKSNCDKRTNLVGDREKKISRVTIYSMGSDVARLIQSFGKLSFSH
jgi:hypothetical protein